MRKIEKDLAEIPQSLVVKEDQLTHTRRKELIKNGAYIDSDAYNSRYKLPDIKDKLENLYHHKCAYCEDHDVQLQVEHYRPKSIYYWLAYSWDNLLYSCSKCNGYKGTHFEIVGKRVTCPKASDDLKEINTWSSRKFDQQELPLLLNPERDELDNVFSFDREGVIYGNNERSKYTIETCKLDRKELNDERKKIVDEFIKHVNVVLYVMADPKDQAAGLYTLLECFKCDAENDSNTFTAYRKAALEWLDDIIKEIVAV